MVTKRRNYTKRRKPKTNRRNTKRHTKRRNLKRKNTKKRNHSKKSNKILIQEGGMFCCAGRRKRKAGVSPTSKAPAKSRTAKGPVKSTSTTEPETEIESDWGNVRVPRKDLRDIKPAGKVGPGLSEMNYTNDARKEWKKMLKEEENKLSKQKVKENEEELKKATVTAAAGNEWLAKARGNIASDVIEQRRRYNESKGRSRPGGKTTI